jgi:hypothetical protein
MTQDDDDLKAFREVVDRANRLASKLYGATTELELNSAYDEITLFLDQSIQNEKFRSADIIMSSFHALFSIDRISLLQNIKLTNRVTKLENRIRDLENR